ncbi:MAG: PorV/PorQ family protein [Candidatus Eisenbacteria bacterium]|nr:PorV/PorQ family protein [Candidatus Eisenbacteria bacterium]
MKLKKLVPLFLGPAILFSSASADKYAGEFLRIGAGARALGMGGAFVAVADDGTAGFWNPAGLVFLKKKELFLMHSEQFGSLLNYDFGSFVFPLEEEGRSAVSVGFVRLGTDNIPYTNDLQFEDYGRDGIQATQDEGENNGIREPYERIIYDEARVQWKSDSESAMMLGYGRIAGERLKLGGSFKIIRQVIGDNSSFGAGLDFGAVYEPAAWVSFGLMAKDFTTTPITWDTGKREFISPTLRMGLQITRHVEKANGAFTVSGDLLLGFEGTRTYSSESPLKRVTADGFVGGEFWFLRSIALRAGLEDGRPNAGAGFRYRRFGVDYAFLSHEDLDASHRVSGSIRF